MSRSKYKVSNTVYETAQNEKDFGGAQRKQALIWSNCKKRKLSKDDFFSPETGEKYKLNILPFIAGSDLNPYIQKGKLKKGQASYLLDLYVHKGIGPNKDSVTCPKMNYGKPCPICEEVAKMKEQAELAEGKEAKAIEKAFSQLKAKRKAFLNVQVFERGEPQAPQVWEAGHFRFMKELLEEANACKDGDEPLQFSCPDEGKIVSFRCGNSDFSKFDVTYKSIQFLDREEEIEEEVLDQTVSFDELISILSAEEINRILWGTDVEEKEVEKTKEAEDEAEAKEAKSSSKEESKEEGTCPNGLVFGEDYYSDPKLCDTCSDECVGTWKACMKANRNG